MKKYLLIILSVILAVALAFSVFFIVRQKEKSERELANTISEICRSVDETKGSLNCLLEGDYLLTQHNQMYVVYGNFNTLYHLFHENRAVYADACDDFLYVGSTFLGGGCYGSFYTTGVFEDERISPNEFAYIKELVKLLDEVVMEIDDKPANEKLEILNANLRAVHEQLNSINASPFIQIRG